MVSYERQVGTLLGRPELQHVLPEQSVQLGSRSIGLGLYIVHEIAPAYGGRVSVTSTDAAGIRFVAPLPRQRSG